MLGHLDVVFQLIFLLLEHEFVLKHEFVVVLFINNFERVCFVFKIDDEKILFLFALRRVRDEEEEKISRFKEQIIAKQFGAGR